MAFTDRRLGVSGSAAFKLPCVAATTENLEDIEGLLTIDGIDLVAGDRVLVKDQETGADNGIYVAGASTWVRAVDFNGPRDIVKGTLVLVIGGTVNGNTVFQQTAASPTIGVTSLSFAMTGADALAFASAFVQTLLDDTSAAAFRTTLGVYSSASVDTMLTGYLLKSFFAAKGDLLAASANDTPALIGVGANGSILMARSAATAGLAYVSPFKSVIHGLTYANNAGDATNDLDVSAGGCMDATGAYWITVAALTKQSDVAWAVGTAAGGLDTGTVGNSDYYIWAIARSDTGVTDVLFSLSSTSPTMPANYDFKRLVGWFKRTGGAIVAFKTWEMVGGGLSFLWTTPTMDINLSALTTARRTDAVKVPLDFETDAAVRIVMSDASSAFSAVVCNPAEADVGPDAAAAPLANIVCASGGNAAAEFVIRTDSTGKIAARATLSTVDQYSVVTLGFRWARR